MKKLENRRTVVFVLTNWNKFTAIQTGNTTIADWNVADQWEPVFTAPEHPLVQCKEIGAQPVDLIPIDVKSLLTNSDSSLDESVYLAWDDDRPENCKQFQKLLIQLVEAKYEIWVIHHTNGIQRRHFAPDYDFEKKINIYRGLHESCLDNGNYYPDIFKILADNQPDKLNRILRDVFSFDKNEDVKDKVESGNMIKQ